MTDVIFLVLGVCPERAVVTLSNLSGLAWEPDGQSTEWLLLGLCLGSGLPEGAERGVACPGEGVRFSRIQVSVFLAGIFSHCCMVVLTS